jgi:phage terminase Nu1 subunit (DNA packaging protein)
MEPDKITRKAFGKALGLSAGRVTQLIKLGLPTCDNGRFILLGVAKAWYEDRIHATAQKRGPKADGKHQTQDKGAADSSAARLLAAQADRAESLAVIAGLEVRRRKDELVEASDVEQGWSKLILAMRSRLLDLPGKLAPRVVRISDVIEVQELIRKEIYAALTALSQYDPEGVPQ